MNDIEFKSTFDKIEFDIAMEMYMKHNGKIASIYDNLGDVYSYKDLGDATSLKEHDTLEEYRKALKEKCDAIDKAIEYINHCEEYAEKLESKYNYIINSKLLSILRGEDNE